VLKVVLKSYFWHKFCGIYASRPSPKSRTCTGSLCPDTYVSPGQRYGPWFARGSCSTSTPGFLSGRAWCGSYSLAQGFRGSCSLENQGDSRTPDKGRLGRPGRIRNEAKKRG